jgi:glycosyltransferase involved in cell wall biosynthesis
MKLTIIIPAYNEQDTICKVLDKLSKVKFPCKTEIIIVDDGSTDDTESRIMNHESRITNIRLIQHSTNRGKGAAIITGIKHATGNYILIQDADLEYDPLQIPQLMKPIFSSNKPIAVFGSRFMQKSVNISKLYFWGNKFLTTLTNILFGTKLSDMETCYKLLPVEIMKRSKLKCKGFEIEPEITIALIRNRIPIIDIPIIYQSRTHLMGKKITYKDAIIATRFIITKRLSGLISQ